MSKNVSAGGIVSPSSLWGKPLPKTLHKTDTKEEKETGMLPKDSVTEDVDDELETDGPSDAELAEEEVEIGDDTAADDSEPSYDDDESEDEEDEDDDEGDEVDSAVEDDKKVSKKKVTDPMAGKKKSMSDYVREEIARRQESDDSLRGVDIMNALAKKGVKVSAAQISQLLKKAGVAGKARGPRKAKEAGETPKRVALSTKKGEAPAKPAGRKPAVGALGLPVERLKAAKAFVAACGDSYDDALSALELHKQLHDVL